MSEAKTKPTNEDVATFISKVSPSWKQKDANTLLKLMEKICGDPPVMWGESIIGFGRYHYVYKSGREGDWMLSGFSPRKANMTIYVMGGFENQKDHLAELGKFKNSVGCLYVKKLSDINLNVLEKIIRRSIDTVKKRYASNN